MFKKLFGKGDHKEAAQDKEKSTEPAADANAPSRWHRLTSSLSKTRKSLRTLFSFRGALNEDFLGEIQAELYATDFGPEIVDELIEGEDGVRDAWKRSEISEPADVRDYLKGLLRKMLTRRERSLASAEMGPTVVLVAGVNGTGKTTSIAKLANILSREGNSVILAAADTFRAAAVEQLTEWSKRIKVDIVTGDANSDPASVAYRGAVEALEKNADYLIVDTAGRLHTQKSLMRELGKIRNVLGKKIPDAPHEALMVLDATTGQNALNQARLFQQEIDISGIVLAKLDGTAKGGIVIAINNQLDIPVKFVGLGEKVDDIERFDPDSFVDALFEA